MKPIYVDIATGTWEENFQKLFQVVKLYGDRCLCLAVADIAMNLYSAVLETRKQGGGEAGSGGGADTLTGGHFLSFFLATNKLACRKLVKGCGGLASVGVTCDEKLVPSLEGGQTGFFKPLAGVSSEGVFKCEPGASIPNPLQNDRNPLGSCAPRIAKLAKCYPELKPFLVGLCAVLLISSLIGALMCSFVNLKFDCLTFLVMNGELQAEKLVGMVEEYVPPGPVIMHFNTRC